MQFSPKVLDLITNWIQKRLGKLRPLASEFAPADVMSV